MLKVRNFIAKLSNKEEGVTALEYALIAALIAVVIIVAVATVGTQANQSFSKVGSAMTSANSN